MGVANSMQKRNNNRPDWSDRTQGIVSVTGINTSSHFHSQ